MLQKSNSDNPLDTFEYMVFVEESDALYFQLKTYKVVDALFFSRIIWIIEEVDTTSAYLEFGILSAYHIQGCGQWSIKWQENHAVSYSYPGEGKHQVTSSYLPKLQWTELTCIGAGERKQVLGEIVEIAHVLTRVYKTLKRSNKKIDKRLQKTKPLYIWLVEAFMLLSSWPVFGFYAGSQNIF